MSGVRFSSSAKNQGGSAISIGDRVQVHISGRLSDGREFGQSKEDNPISFIVGSGEVIPGIEEALVGLRKGTTTNIEIAPTKAFGKEKRVYSIPRKELRLR
jgi:FKBP-type peptidyl-prolyl cis-trans isomerase